MSKRLFAVAVLMLIGSIFLFARDWPDDPQAVTGAFGDSVDGAFRRGLEFAADGQRVRTWSSGEVIWTSGPSSSEDAVPSEGLVVIEHPDSFRSSYYGVEARPDLEDRISRGQWIGYSGSESWVFEIRDDEMEKLIDPLTLLPAREDVSAPRLGEVYLVSDDGQRALTSGMTIPSGRWSVMVDAAYAGSPQAIPSEISLYWVGERVGILRFDALREQDGQVVIEAPDALSHDSVYGPDGTLALRNILFNVGQGTLELRLKDESGTVVSRSWNLSVRNP